ncbi:F-box/WD repeat-containing protein 10-like [Patagioenas fasciata]|uniref:F-box/WD repeat-containing protein 10-like n=1 Tax=Patagioenas fasciata TaxID=372321 RepID=UPI003A99F33E
MSPRCLNDNNKSYWRLGGLIRVYKLKKCGLSLGGGDQCRKVYVEAGLLDEKSLEACASVNRFWAHLVEEVNKERECQKTIQESILYLQRGERREEKDNLQEAYSDLKTDAIQLEERNVFCGSYSVRVLMDQSDQSRIIHYSGGDLVAVGSASRKVRFLGMPGTKEVPPLLSGSAGSKALLLDENKGLVLSTGFDLSIRCWNIYSGACVKVFDGHRGTVTCLDLHEEQLVSGARDGMVKVWNLRSGRCLQTLQHSSAVWVVRTDGARVVSGCERGLVRVWAADTGALIKTLEEHQGPVKCLSFDQWHLVTGSTDGSALGWSMLGKLSRCLVAFHHPKEVVSLQLLYLRVLSGCADGNIRIFNYLTGTCLKVLTAETSGGPISSVHVSENRMVINSPAVVLVFQFEDVSWDYTLDAAREVAGKTNQQQATWSRTAVPCWRRLYHDRMRRLALEPEGAGGSCFQPGSAAGH